MLTNDEILKDNKILLISEKEQKVFLPYMMQDIKEILEENNTYNSEQDVINNLYIVPLYLYKSTAISRFREAFLLMRNEPNSTFKQAIELGFEVMFNYSLHPSIITACKNLDEFDIYLDCLYNNELDDFKCFKVIFDVNPTVSINNDISNNITLESSSDYIHNIKSKHIYTNILKTIFSRKKIVPKH